jgi:hypothetical protein
MKKLLVALMAVSLVLFAVSFAMAQSSSSTASINSFQMVIPPGGPFPGTGTSGTVSTPGVTATFTTQNALPVQSHNPSAAGASSTFGGYSASAAGVGAQGGLQTAPNLPYGFLQVGGGAASVRGSIF